MFSKRLYQHDDQDKTGDKGVGTPFICREGPDGKDGFISRIKYSKLSQEFKPALHCQFLVCRQCLLDLLFITDKCVMNQQFRSIYMHLVFQFCIFSSTLKVPNQQVMEKPPLQCQIWTTWWFPGGAEKIFHALQWWGMSWWALLTLCTLTM